MESDALGNAHRRVVGWPSPNHQRSAWLKCLGHGDRLTRRLACESLAPRIRRKAIVEIPTVGPAEHQVSDTDDTDHQLFVLDGPVTKAIVLPAANPLTHLRLALCRRRC